MFKIIIIQNTYSASYTIKSDVNKDNISKKKSALNFKHISLNTSSFKQNIKLNQTKLLYIKTCRLKQNVIERGTV